MKKLFVAGSLFSALAFGLLSVSSASQIGSDSFYGSTASSLSGSSSASHSRGYSSSVNPAQIGSYQNNARVKAGYGLVFSRPSFEEIQNVTVENSFTSDSGVVTSGNVNVEYPDTFGQVIGLEARVAPDLWDFSIGMSAFLPLNQILTIDSGNTYLPEYALYRTETQKPDMQVGFSVSPTSQLRLGAAIRLGFSATSSATMFLKTSDSLPSSMRFTSVIQPKFAPTLAAQYWFEKERRNAFAVIAKLPMTFSNEISVDADAEALSGLAGIPINLTASSGLYYQPLVIELSSTLELIENHRFHTSIDFRHWTQYQPPFLSVIPTGGISINPTVAPSLDLRNIWVPKMGYEYDSGWIVYRLSTLYRPGIFNSLPTGTGNYLDPDRVSVGLGVGLEWQEWDLNFHMSYSSLFAQTVQKTSGNEAGESSETKIGAPSYSIGGHVIGAGISASIGL